MIIFRRFILGATQIQTMLNDTLKDRKRKGKTPVEWTPEHEEVFAKVKESLIQATRLDTLTRNSRVTDASDTIIGAFIDHRIL